jgi:hypothetical protein
MFSEESRTGLPGSVELQCISVVVRKSVTPCLLILCNLVSLKRMQEESKLGEVSSQFHSSFSMKSCQWAPFLFSVSVPVPTGLFRLSRQIIADLKHISTLVLHSSVVIPLIFALFLQNLQKF